MQAMGSGVNIKADEYFIKDLFDERFLFNIPDYQRPFSWERDNFEQLCEDMDSVISFDFENIKSKGMEEEVEPFFVGSIILCSKKEWADGSGEYDIIDGQQRITSFIILMAVMRDITAESDAKRTLQELIYQKGDEFKGTPERIKLQVREREFDFFKEYILTEDGTLKLLEDKPDDLSEPQERMVEAVKLFSNFFKDENGNVDQKYLNVFIKYFLQKVVVVVVRTNSIYSAFRLFNVINARGLPLNNSDLLKSENLRAIDDVDRPKYTEIWENLEEDLESDGLEMLIRFIRSIKLKEKADRSVAEEFEKKVFPEDPDFKGKPFIDYLNHIASIYQDRILDGNLRSGDARKDTYFFNLINTMANFLPFNEWMTAFIKFDEKFKDEEKLLEFLKKLEKKVVVDWISRLSFTERLTRIYKIIEIIENSTTPDEVITSERLNEEVTAREKSFRDSLNDVNFYRMGRFQYAKYILLRIDMEKYDNLGLKREYAKNVTVEHILPRNPNDEYWLNRFTNPQRLEWTNRLGNLVLLEGSKNTSAGNKPFDKKLNEYFKKKSDFAVTNELENISDWTLDELKKRHERLIEEAVGIWIGS